MTEPVTPEQERDALAAELALGVLDGEERARALRLKLADPGFAAAVAAWEVRLDPLGEAFDPAAAPNVWPAVERRLTARDGGDVPALRRWRFTAIGSGALAASLALVLLLRPLPAPVEIVRAPDRMAVVQMAGEEPGVLLAANYDPAAGELNIRALKMPDSSLAPELWVIPSDGVPRSLGLVSHDGLSRMTVSAEHRGLMEDGATLAVTMEPREGAPHKAPSSAPIASGKISTI